MPFIVETQYIIKQCSRPDYAQNGFAFPNDVPFVLAQGILEWKATIGQLAKATPNPLGEHAISPDPTLVPTQNYEQLSAGKNLCDCGRAYCSNMVVIPPGTSVMESSDKLQVKGNWLDPEGLYAVADFNNKRYLPRNTAGFVTHTVRLDLD